MDGYTKAAIKEAMAKRSARQVRFDEIMARVFNGFMRVFTGFIVYVLGILFYGFWGWVIWESLL